MKRNKLFATLIICVLLAGSVLGGCTGKADLAAKVGDREISVAQLGNSYLNYSAYASYYGYDLATEEGISSFRDYLLDSMISDEMLIYQAYQQGLTLTAEEETSAQATADASFESTYQSFVDSAESAGASDVNAYATQLFTDALVQNKTTLSALKKDMLLDAKDGLLADKLEAQIKAEVSYTAEELADEFEKELAAEIELFDADPSQYFTYETNALYGYGIAPLYVPEGFFRVRHILVKDQETALLVQQKLSEGEDFEALMIKYNTDEGMNSEENADGYLIGEGANYVDAFLAAALALENEGDISDTVESSYGFHIIQRLKDEPSSVSKYEDVKDTFDAFWTNQLKAKHYNDVLDAWLADEALVTRYPEHYASVGK